MIALAALERNLAHDIQSRDFPQETIKAPLHTSYNLSCSPIYFTVLPDLKCVPGLFEGDGHFVCETLGSLKSSLAQLGISTRSGQGRGCCVLMCRCAGGKTVRRVGLQSE